MDYYIIFNLIEAIFWIAIGLIILVFSIRNIHVRKCKKLAFYAFIAFALFGISDILETFIGNFLDIGMEWLFIWKIINIAALVGIFILFIFTKAEIKSKPL